MSGKNEKVKMLFITTAETRAHLRKASDETSNSMSALINLFISQGLSNLSETYTGKTSERLDNIQDETVTKRLDEITKMLGSIQGDVETLGEKTKDNSSVVDDFINAFNESKKPKPLTDKQKENRAKRKEQKEIQEGYFEEFWERYPRRIGKKRANEYWHRKTITAETFKEIMAGLDRYIELDWKGKNMDYIPHPSTWINQERWKDEVINGKLGKSTRADYGSNANGNKGTGGKTAIIGTVVGGNSDK